MARCLHSVLKAWCPSALPRMCRARFSTAIWGMSHRHHSVWLFIRSCVSHSRRTCWCAMQAMFLRLAATKFIQPILLAPLALIIQGFTKEGAIAINWLRLVVNRINVLRSSCRLCDWLGRQTDASFFTADVWIKHGPRVSHTHCVRALNGRARCMTHRTLAVPALYLPLGHSHVTLTSHACTNTVSLLLLSSKTVSRGLRLDFGHTPKYDLSFFKLMAYCESPFLRASFLLVQRRFQWI